MYSPGHAVVVNLLMRWPILIPVGVGVGITNYVTKPEPPPVVIEAPVPEVQPPPLVVYDPPVEKKIRE